MEIQWMALLGTALLVALATLTGEPGSLDRSLERELSVSQRIDGESARIRMEGEYLAQIHSARSAVSPIIELDGMLITVSMDEL